PRVLVPRSPGVTSALGLLLADQRHDYVRTVLSLVAAQSDRRDAALPATLSRRYAEMEAEAAAQLQREGVAPHKVSMLRLADVRYLGQGYELEVAVPAGTLDAAQLGGIVSRFHDAHKHQYGYAN